MEPEKNKRKQSEDLSEQDRAFTEQLLLIKKNLEKLQSDFGSDSNFLLLIENNVTLKSNEKVGDLSTSGRVLCCGSGDVKNFFCQGNLAFEPSVMSFLEPGEKLEEDKQFLADWGDAVKLRGQVKQEAGSQNNFNEANPEFGDNMSPNNMAAMANMFAQLQALANVKQEQFEAGQSGFEGNMDINNIVKAEPIDNDGDIDPSQFLATSGQSTSGISGMTPFQITPELIRLADLRAQAMAKQSEEGGVNYSCSICDFKTDCSKRLSVHVRSFHKPGLKKMICKECKFTSMNKQAMSAHIMSQHRKDLIRCKEDKCSFYTISIEQFRAHAEEHKQNVPGISLDFKCDFCNFKSSSRKGIGVHINRIHATESPAMKMMQKKKNQRHEAKKQELQALINQQRKLPSLNIKKIS